MLVTLDTDKKTLHCDGRSLDLYGDEAFELLSDLWVKVGWNQKYIYTFSWFGRPVIQLPEDMIRMQEVIYATQPDVIVETGVAHGGSLVYYASLCKAMGRGRIIGVDIEIRPHNRQAIESHPLASWITLVVGDSVAPDIVSQVRRSIAADQKVLVILDSCHIKDHVAKELEAYYPLVSIGSYIVATDGVMHQVHDVPRGTPGWLHDDPTAAAAEFAARHPEFELVQPEWPFNESTLSKKVTHWPGAWLRRTA